MIPVANTNNSTIRLPNISPRIGIAIIPMTKPKANIDWIVDLMFYFSQYSSFLKTAVKSLVIEHLRKSRQALGSVVSIPLHTKRGFINTNDPIIALYVIKIHIRQTNTAMKYW